VTRNLFVSVSILTLNAGEGMLGNVGIQRRTMSDFILDMHSQDIIMSTTFLVGHFEFNSRPTGYPCRTLSVSVALLCWPREQIPKLEKVITLCIQERQRQTKRRIEVSYPLTRRVNKD